MNDRMKIINKTAQHDERQHGKNENQKEEKKMSGKILKDEWRIESENVGMKKSTNDERMKNVRKGRTGGRMRERKVKRNEQQQKKVEKGKNNLWWKNEKKHKKNRDIEIQQNKCQ